MKENSEKAWSVTFSSVGVQYVWGEAQKCISKDFKKLFIAGDTFFPEISHFLSKTHTVPPCQDSVTSQSLCIYFSYPKHGSLKFAFTFHDLRYIMSDFKHFHWEKNAFSLSQTECTTYLSIIKYNRSSSL